MKQMKLFVAAAAACACPTMGLNQAQAAFTETDQFMVDPIQYHGITTDGTDWCLAKPWNPEWNVYDAGWNYMDNIVVAGAFQIRGMSFHTASGHLVVADYGGSTVHEVQTDGTVVNSFAGMPSMNSVTVNNDDDTVWIVSYQGTVEHRTFTGAPLGSFSTAYNWTGVAVDTVAQTLLLLDGGDTLYEYTFAGTQVGTPLPGDQIDFNGQDLHYDCSTATLYVTSVDSGPNPFESWVTVFHDPDRPTCGGPPCPADVNGDSMVDVLDLLAVLAAWGNVGGPEDVNGDGVVNVLDLLEVLSSWGPC